MTDQTMTDRFVDDVLSCLRGTYQAEDGKLFQGASISFLLSEMHDKRWTGLGNLNDFENLLEQQGFVVRQGKPGRWYRTGWKYAGHARVVTV
jgi:hypothetical protein